MPNRLSFQDLKFRLSLACPHPISPLHQLLQSQWKTTVDEELTIVLPDNNIILLAQKTHHLFNGFRMLGR